MTVALKPTLPTQASSSDLAQNLPAAPYRGRFAPSPTGPLHQGSLVAAMASYLDARAHDGKWLLRIEDLDFDRNLPGADSAILRTLERCGMEWDEPVVWQSQRQDLYQAALAQLGARVYPCACSRKEIADSILRATNPASAANSNQVYPGTCRLGLAAGKVARAWRLRVPELAEAEFSFIDRRLGLCQQNLAREVGDFVVRRADGFWAYQLAVVVDDAAQGISDIVRGVDLLDSTARQLYLQNLLSYPQPRYYHVAVVNNEQGEKLSKQTGARAIDEGNNDLLRQALLPAAQFLNLQLGDSPATCAEFWSLAIAAWRAQLSKL